MWQTQKIVRFNWKSDAAFRLVISRCYRPKRRELNKLCGRAIAPAFLQGNYPTSYFLMFLTESFEVSTEKRKLRALRIAHHFGQVHIVSPNADSCTTCPYYLTFLQGRGLFEIYSHPSQAFPDPLSVRCLLGDPENETENKSQKPHTQSRYKSSLTVCKCNQRTDSACIQVCIFQQQATHQANSGAILQRIVFFFLITHISCAFISVMM